MHFSTRQKPEAPARDTELTMGGELRARRGLVAAAGCLIGLGYLALTPDTNLLVMVDHQVFRRAVQEMQSGHSYYQSMDQALREVYGPAATVRAFRMPTLFFLWRCLPSEWCIWVVFVVVVVATVPMMLGLVETPLVVLVVLIYLLNLGKTPTADGWVAQFTATELWAVPVVIAAAYAWRKEYPSCAAPLSLLAVLIRETTAGLLIGGLVLSHLKGYRRWPWAMATGLAALVYLTHVAHVSPYLVPPSQGRETPLLGTGSIAGVTRMMGFGLPWGEVFGPVLWLLAVWRIARPGSRLGFTLCHLGLPIVGVAAGRDYWGILVVPFALLWGADEVLLQIFRGIRCTFRRDTSPKRQRGSPLSRAGASGSGNARL